MIINSIDLPKWMIKRIESLYPHLSTQSAIKHYLKDQLNGESRAEHFTTTKNRLNSNVRVKRDR